MYIRDEIDTVIIEICGKVKQKLQTGKKQDLNDAIDLTDALADLAEARAKLKD